MAPDICPLEVWAALYLAHLLRKEGRLGRTQEWVPLTRGLGSEASPGTTATAHGYRISPGGPPSAAALAAAFESVACGPRR